MFLRKLRLKVNFKCKVYSLTLCFVTQFSIVLFLGQPKSLFVIKAWKNKYTDKQWDDFRFQFWSTTLMKMIWGTNNRIKWYQNPETHTCFWNSFRNMFENTHAPTFILTFSRLTWSFGPRQCWADILIKSTYKQWTPISVG